MTNVRDAADGAMVGAIAGNKAAAKVPSPSGIPHENAGPTVKRRMLRFPITTGALILSGLHLTAGLFVQIDLLAWPATFLGRMEQSVRDEILTMVLLTGVAFLVDSTISRRRAARAESLWTATERLRALEEAAPAGIMALDRQGRVTIWNRAAEQLFGWRADEVLGRASPLIPPEKKADDQALAARVLAGEVVSGVETSHLRQDGSEVSISVSCGPIRDAEGHVAGTMRVLTDTTEPKRLAQQFLQAQKMEAVGRLAGGIAHDFNNLLTVIIGFSDMVRDQVGNRPDLVSDVDEIRKAGERAAKLTRQLLAFSRKQPWVPQILDLNQVVAAFEKMLSRIIREDIRVEMVTERLLRPTKADPGQVEQVIMNLVVNARDAMPHGGTLTIATANAVLEVDLATHPANAAPGRYVALTVTDTGTGMTPDVLAHLFEPFFTTKGPAHGTGLGLSTVFGLVQHSGGYIAVESAPGAGTSVTTYWPVVDAVIDAPAAAFNGPTLEGTETILLVEDETSVRHLMGKVLTRYGYTVVPARDAEDALEIEGRYAGAIHLLVTDMIMPGLSGADLAQRLIRHRPTIQVLFASGYTGDERFDAGETSQSAGFLQKPFTPDTLTKKVRERLDRRADPGNASPPGCE